MRLWVLRECLKQYFLSSVLDFEFVPLFGVDFECCCRRECSSSGAGCLVSDPRDAVTHWMP